MQPDSLLNPPDGIYATIGVTDPIGDFSGYFAFTNPGNWTGLTVFTTEVILNLKKGILGIPEGQIAKVDSNDIITYTIDLDNKENDFPVTDVLVVDYLPAEVTFINATVGNASGFYDPKTHTYNWSYPSLQVGAAEHLELVVSVNSNLPLGTIITNIVTIDSDEIPPFTTSIDAVVPYKPLNIVKKAVDMSGSEIVWINPGERFTYQICFDNNNESMVTDVLIVDQLPDEVTFVMADDGKATGKYDEKAHTYTCTYGSLEPGLTECLELVVDVKPEVDMDTIITNSVTIDSNETLPTTADIDVVIGESLLEFISLEIHMEHIWDYNDPADDSDLTFEFRLRIEVIGIDSVYEEIVDSVEFLTPAGNTFRIPKQPGQWSDDIWTSYEYDPEWDWATWQYRAILTKLDDLQEYGDGEYTITPIYTDGTRDSETFWFGIPDTNDPIPQPTQEPVITFPLHKQIAESPVTFTWEPCKDTNASEVGIEMQEQETGAFKEEYFDVSETEWGPVILTDGLWQADLVFGHWETLEFNNILFNFSKSSRSRYVFTVFGYPRTTYEVWGGDTWIYWDEGSYRKIADLEEYGYKKLGESDGKTATFTGEYEYYLIATRGRFLLDSIQGSDGSYYSSFEANCSRGNISSEDYLLGPPDEQYAIVGSGNPWYQDDFSGYMTFTDPGNWTGLTVLVGEITPSEVENLSITPNVLRRNGTSQYITAIVQFPEGIKQSDIDPDDRAELYYQDRSTKEFVLIGEGSRPDIYGTEDRPKINISFDRSELMDALYGYGEFKLRVKGKLKSGQTYYGDDMINVTRFAGD